MVCLFTSCSYSNNTTRCIRLKLATKIGKYNFACYFISLWQMVFHIMGRTWAEGLRKPDGEKKIHEEGLDEFRSSPTI